MEWTAASLRVLGVVAETGSFTRAAASLGYTQSAVSRQIAVLERAAGVRLFERLPGGAQVTPAGAVPLRHASAALGQLDRAEAVLHGTDAGQRTVRLGVFTSLGRALIPQTLDIAARRTPGLRIVTREGSTAALTRSLRAATLDVAVIASRSPYPPPDDRRPPLTLQVLLEGDLMVAVPAAGDLGEDGTTTVAQVQAAKLALVAGGHGVTTLPPYLVDLLPAGVRVARVVDGAPVTARVVAARLPGAPVPAVLDVLDHLAHAAADLPLA